MKKRILGIKIKNIIIFLIVMIIIITASVNINQVILNKSPIPQNISGKWSGQSAVSSQFSKSNQSAANGQEMVNIEITINADKNVTGKIGDAEFAGCTIKLNRTWFERLINVKTDYIITGSMKNGIVSADTAETRQISIPFSISNKELKGSVFEIEKWKYPNPLLSRLILTRNGE